MTNELDVLELVMGKAPALADEMMASPDLEILLGLRATTVSWLLDTVRVKVLEDRIDLRTPQQLRTAVWGAMVGAIFPFEDTPAAAWIAGALTVVAREQAAG